MDVISTRNKNIKMPALGAVLKGIAGDGGLFVPETFPVLDIGKIIKLSEKGYAHTAAEVLSMFFDIPKDELLALAVDAYAGFDTTQVAPLAALDGAYIMELWHGPTLAFKDMALQVLPRLMQKAMRRQPDGKKVLILTATSGDTGKAAMEGFRDVDGTAIVVLFPSRGVSDMQKLQMVTQEGGNVLACAVHGNFDDAQTGVKELFADEAFTKEILDAGYHLSSANSINFGRLVPQIAYYVYAYAKLAAEKKVVPGGLIDIVVPTGNFGNILAAYYAKQMGLPVRRLVCASNRNNVLTDFFNRGEYSANRDFYKTMSPSMDILISSNLERLLFELCDRDEAAVSAWMDSLKKQGEYKVPQSVVEKMKVDFWADYCDDEKTAQTIKDVFEEYGYLLDTHTAVAWAVYEEYLRGEKDPLPTVVASTANPFKFVPDVLGSLTGEEPAGDIFEQAGTLAALAHTEVPGRIAELKTKQVRHTGAIEKSELKEMIRAFVEEINGR
jgi:threonine synthase